MKIFRFEQRGNREGVFRAGAKSRIGKARLFATGRWFKSFPFLILTFSFLISPALASPFFEDCTRGEEGDITAEFAKGGARGLPPSFADLALQKAIAGGAEEDSSPGIKQNFEACVENLRERDAAGEEGFNFDKEAPVLYEAFLDYLDGWWDPTTSSKTKTLCQQAVDGLDLDAYGIEMKEKTPIAWLATFSASCRSRVESLKNLAETLLIEETISRGAERRWQPATAEIIELKKLIDFSGEELAKAQRALQYWLQEITHLPRFE